MKCPTCREVTLVISERQGLEIDYCPQCRGVWLDRGELDKLLERASSQPHSGQATSRPYEREQSPSHYGHGYHREHRHHKSWLSEIFD